MKRFLSALLCLLMASPVSAIPTEEILDQYAINGIYYYDDSECEDRTVPASGQSVTWIGDSYTAIAEEDYKLISTNLPDTDLGTAENPYYQVSKHFQMEGGPGNLGGPSGLTILKNIKAQNKLQPNLVFALSTNDPDFGNNPGAFESQLNILIDSAHAGTDTTVILVSPRTRNASDNVAYDSIADTMRKFADSHNNVLVADWNKAAAGKEAEYFQGSDDTHPNQKGFEAWFETIKNTLPRDVNGNSNLQAAALPAETTQYLDSDNVKGKAEANMERYKYAEQKTKLPWQILASLHYREGGMGSNQSISNGEELYDHVNVDGIHVSADPNQDALDAANHFIDNTKSIYGVDVIAEPTLENYALGFLAYNRGSMYKAAGASWQESPYVMNGYDSNHMHMHWIHADSWFGNQQLNSIEGKVDGNPGALAVLAYLGATATYSGDGCEVSPGYGGAAIAQMAVNMSWPFQEGDKTGHCITIGGNLVPYNHNDGAFGCSKNPRDSYEKAVSDFHIPHASLDYYRNCKDATYCDCGMFVQTVLAATFPDENFASHNPNVHEEFVNYLLSQPDKWEEVENKGNTSNLRPGDIFLNSGHRMIYVGDYGGKWGDLASASAGDYVGEISNVYFNHSAGPFRIFRRKGGTIGENGLTEEQAAKLLAWYAQNKNDDTRQTIGASYYDRYACQPNQCTAFSTFFLNKFTKLRGDGNYTGSYTVDAIIGQNPGAGSPTSEPSVFSLFQAPGHTGIVVGKTDDGKFIYANYNGHNCKSLPESVAEINNFNPEEYYAWNYGRWGNAPHVGIVSYDTGVGGTPTYLNLEVDTQKLLDYINNGP